MAVGKREKGAINITVLIRFAQHAFCSLNIGTKKEAVNFVKNRLHCNSNNAFLFRLCDFDVVRF